MVALLSVCHLFSLNATTSTYMYTLSLHDALPISMIGRRLPALLTCVPPIVISYVKGQRALSTPFIICNTRAVGFLPSWKSSEEHTSELQSQSKIVCRLLLDKKN